MNHIKLFENWAEEIQVPEYREAGGYSILDDEIQDRIKNRKCDVGWYGEEDNYDYVTISFKSFSDYDFWRKDGYEYLKFNQYGVNQPLVDLFGVPKTKELWLSTNEIKSLRGLENTSIKNLIFRNMVFENLKYLPKNSVVKLEETNMVLSLYNESESIVHNSLNTICFENYYDSGLYIKKDNDVNHSFFSNIKIHADAFCNFENDLINLEYYEHSGSDIREEDIHAIRPWEAIYHDPSDVGNYEFLFLPFYKESETFREKANDYIENLDLSGVTRSKEKLW